MTIHPRRTAIAEACKASDVSRDELARRMGFSTSTAYRIDARRSAPSPEFIAALMIETGRTFEELFELVPEDIAS